MMEGRRRAREESGKELHFRKFFHFYNPILAKNTGKLKKLLQKQKISSKKFGGFKKRCFLCSGNKKKQRINL